MDYPVNKIKKYSKERIFNMEQAQLRSIWEQILNSIRNQLSASAVDKWLTPLRPLSLTDDELKLATTTDFTKEWITSRYLAFIEDAIIATLGSKRQLTIEVLPENIDVPSDEPIPSLFKIDEEEEKANTEPEELDIDLMPPEPIKPADGFLLNPKYTFETFITGSSNRFAHAAAQAVAEKPGHIYNPLFMYGGVGLGKTHLMHAIGNRVLQNYPDLRVLYVSSEQFTNEIIRSIQEGTAEKFRQKYRSIDVLMIDDIQFLSGKTSTQEEFFHTFNTLRDAHKAIIISSDRPPHEVERLEERLRSRFEGGLTVDIKAPDLETRIAILKNKAQLEKYSIPNDVMVFIASRIDSNIRELEGALTRVVAYASLLNKPVTTGLVADALRDILPNSDTKTITIEIIQEIVASYFKLTVEDLHSKKRTRSIAYPRQIAMYLCRELTDTSLPQIGKFFGGRDHTTVLHACKLIAKEKGDDLKVSTMLNELIERIQKI